MGGRTEARKQLLEEAHEGRETRGTDARVRRVGPRRWMTRSEYGYDYLETILNWRPSRMQVLGLLVTLAGLTAVLLITTWLAQANA